jgi:outer membrane lipoprotein-sorting protein
MHRFPSIPRRRLVAVLAAVAVVALGAGVALGASDSAPKPPHRPLAQALLSALQSKPVDGVSARIRFTNNLLPAGSLPKGTTLPFGASAEGRIWLRRDGRLRLDVHSDAGDAEVTYDGARLRVYDAGSNTVSTFALRAPAPASAPGGGPGSLGGLVAKLGPLMSMLNVSGAIPSSTAGRPTYTVRVSPKDDGGLLGAAEVAWDAEKGVPLRAAVYAQGNDEPVLELRVTDIVYGPVAADALAATPHPGARQVDLDATEVAGGRAGAGAADVSGLDAVQRRLPFRMVAPPELAGLSRGDAHLVAEGHDAGAVLTYGKGLGAILVFEGPARTGSPLAGLPLAEVNIDGGTGKELATALGTVVTFQRDGVSFTVAGLVPPVAAENAARGLR